MGLSRAGGMASGSYGNIQAGQSRRVRAVVRNKARTAWKLNYRQRLSPIRPLLINIRRGKSSMEKIFGNLLCRSKRWPRRDPQKVRAELAA